MIFWCHSAQDRCVTTVTGSVTKFCKELALSNVILVQVYFFDFMMFPFLVFFPVLALSPLSSLLSAPGLLCLHRPRPLLVRK